MKHGLKGTPLYEIWKGMRARCNNKNHIGYKNYGAKGITVCSRWNDFKKFHDDLFKDYIKHIKKHGKRNTSLDRIDPKKGYEPNNCRWATRLEQGMKTSRVVYVKYNGKTKTIAEWSRILGIEYHTLYSRYKRYKRLTLLKDGK